MREVSKIHKHRNCVMWIRKLNIPFYVDKRAKKMINRYTTALKYLSIIVKLDFDI